MTDFSQFSMQDLKRFIADNRANDAACSAAMSELLSRDTDATVYPPNLPEETMAQVFQQRLERSHSKQS